MLATKTAEDVLMRDGHLRSFSDDVTKSAPTAPTKIRQQENGSGINEGCDPHRRVQGGQACDQPEEILFARARRSVAEGAAFPPGCE